MHPAMRLLALTLTTTTAGLLADGGVPFLDRRVFARAVVNLALVAAFGVAWMRAHF